MPSFCTDYHKNRTLQVGTKFKIFFIWFIHSFSLTHHIYLKHVEVKIKDFNSALCSLDNTVSDLSGKSRNWESISITQKEE